MEACMKLSVIILVYNEKKSLPKLLKYLEPLKYDAEILLVDGGSMDGTTEHLPDFVRLIKSEKGRAKQLNAGAKAAKGEILFFLHADSYPPKTFVSDIYRCIQSAPFGFFGIRFDDESLLMRICAILSNRRAIKNHIVFGDQGMFMTKRFFIEQGGFPVVPLMEDFIFSLRLKKKGIWGSWTGHVITTSARRYPEGTRAKLKTMYGMYKLRRDFLQGTPIDEIASRYRDIR